MEPPLKKKILIIAGDFVEDYELMVPYQAFLMVGHDVDVVCPDKQKGETIKTAVHDFEGDQTYSEKPGHKFILNQDFNPVRGEDYDALYIPGGRAPEYLRLNHRVLEITKHFLEKDKPVGAVCHGIQVLTATDHIKGKKVTCYPACSPEVTLSHAEYQDIGLEDAYADGNLITGKAWTSHPRFIQLFLERLGSGFCEKKHV